MEARKILTGNDDHSSGKVGNLVDVELGLWGIPLHDGRPKLLELGKGVSHLHVRFSKACCEETKLKFAMSLRVAAGRAYISPEATQGRIPCRLNAWPYGWPLHGRAGRCVRPAERGTEMSRD